jgi:hypothetical protein
MKAHDVRHLCVCALCEGLADDRAAIPREPTPEYYHPACFVEKFGEARVLSLPPEDRKKFRICDVSAETMRKLIETA